MGEGDDRDLSKQQLKRFGGGEIIRNVLLQASPLNVQPTEHKCAPTATTLTRARDEAAGRPSQQYFRVNQLGGRSLLVDRTRRRKTTDGIGSDIFVYCSHSGIRGYAAAHAKPERHDHRRIAPADSLKTVIEEKKINNKKKPKTSCFVDAADGAQPQVRRGRSINHYLVFPRTVFIHVTRTRRRRSAGGFHRSDRDRL